MIDHRSYAHNLGSCEIKDWKYSGLNGIRTHDLCDTGAVLYQLNYQAILELIILWVRNIPIDDEEYKWIYERLYIWTAEKDIKTFSAVKIYDLSYIHLYYCHVTIIHNNISSSM